MIRITLNKIAVSLAAVCAVLVGLVFHLYRQVNADQTEAIIIQSAICANNIPGAGLERRGEFLVGWLNVLVDGKYKIEVPGATRLIVGRDIDLKSAPNDSITLYMKQGKYEKIIVQIPADKQFHPKWTFPNGLQWDIPAWAMYAGGGALPPRSALRQDVAIIPALKQKEKP